MQKSIDLNRDFFNIYIRIVDTRFIIAAVITDAENNPVYARELDVLNDVLTDSPINDAVDDAQRKLLDDAITTDYLTSEIDLLKDHCPTGEVSEEFGLQLYHCDDIDAHLDLNV